MCAHFEIHVDAHTHVFASCTCVYGQICYKLKFKISLRSDLPLLRYLQIIELCGFFLPLLKSYGSHLSNTLSSMFVVVGGWVGVEIVPKRDKLKLKLLFLIQ